MGDINDLALTRAQTAARNYNQALRILKTCPADLLQETYMDGSHWVLSPSVQRTIRDNKDYEASMPVAIAAKVNRNKRRVTENDLLYLVMDSNVIAPAFDITRDETDLRRTMADINGESLDEKYVDLVLNDIERSIQSIIHDRQNAEQQARRRRRKKAVNTALSLACIAIVGGGGYASWQWKQHKDQQEAAQRHAADEAATKAFWDKIAAYDAKNIMLQSPLLGPSSAGTARIDRFALSLLDQTPVFEDLLDNPRKTVIRAGENKALAKVPLGKGVRVVSDAPEGHVMVDVLDDGSTWLVALPTAGMPLYNVIIQSQNLPK